MPKEPVFLPLRDAYLCSGCSAIGNSANRCPACLSDALLAVARIIPQHEDSIRLVAVDPKPQPTVEAVEQEFYRPEKRDWFSPSVSK